MRWELARNRFLFFVFLIAVVGMGGCDKKERHSHDHEHGEIVGALLVSDAEVGLIRIVDLHDGGIVSSIDIEGPATIYPTEHTYYGVAIQTADGLVNFIDTGIEIEEHGDHFHLHVGEPELLNFELFGSTPIHFVSHEGWSAIHFDGSRDEGIGAEVAAVLESTLEDSAPEVLYFSLDGPAHGAAVPARDNNFLITVPNPEYVNGVPNASSLPIGVNVYDEFGALLQEFADVSDPDSSCVDLHGEAVTGNHYAFACGANLGVLVLSYNQGSGLFSSKNISYPAADVRTGTLIAHGSKSFFVGNFGSNALIKINPSNSNTEVLDLPADQCGFVFEKDGGNEVAVLTIDGFVHVIDSNAWVIEESIPVTSPFSCTGIRPRLAAGPGVAYVSIPDDGMVIEVGLHEPEIIRELEVGGTPGTMTAFAIEEVEH
jgi:hypothetical protein